MNERQKITAVWQIDEEEILIDLMKETYEEAMKHIDEKIKILQSSEQTQSKIYQIKYQNQLKSQIGAILDKMNDKNYTEMDSYLKECYEDAFIGTMYDLHGQGVPLIFPIDQQSIANAIVKDTNLKWSLYESLGHNVDELKLKINKEISRGIATASSFNEIARNIRNQANISLNKAIRIARTEGHRVQNTASFEAQQKAKQSGADIVKLWDSTMDKKTRKSHAKLDGQIREIDEPFEVNGRTSMYPSGFGVASEDINCRCALLQRAKWGLDEEELETLKKRAEFFGLDKEKDFEAFKKKYLKASKMAYNGSAVGVVKGNVLNKPISSNDQYYDKLLTKLNKNTIEYKPVQNHLSQLNNDEIISVLSGGDNTSGSCASLGLAYIGQKQGWNVLDFRGGESQRFFSSSLNLLDLAQANGMKVLKAQGASSLTVGNRLLKQCEVGKEYYLNVGRHVAIVRKLSDGTLQYLELQSANSSGWTNFNGNPKYTLNHRFGCTSASSSSSYYDYMIDIDESDFSTDEFKSLLGYINTEEGMQKKGKHGTIK